MENEKIYALSSRQLNNREFPLAYLKDEDEEEDFVDQLEILKIINGNK